MKIEKQKHEKATILALSGRMDAVTSPEFENSFSELIAQGEKSFVVDLSGLEYISSAGLRGILNSAKRVGQVQGKLVFTGLQGSVHEVLKISGFLSILKVSPTAAEALSGM